MRRFTCEFDLFEVLDLLIDEERALPAIKDVTVSEEER
jgi:hypothetical protein